MKIACIEDNDGDFYLARKKILESFQNCEVKSYRYLNDFLETKNPYDIIITDLTLPDAYGPDVLQKIRKITGKPIIVLSGVGGSCLPETLIDSIKATGATVFLSKHRQGISRLPDILSQFI